MLKLYITDPTDLKEKYELFARRLGDVCNEELQRVEDNKKKVTGAVVGPAVPGPLVLPRGPLDGAVGAAVGAEMAVKRGMGIADVGLAAGGAATATAANATVQAFNTLHPVPHLSELGIDVNTENEDMSGGENGEAGINVHDNHAYEDSSDSEMDISDKEKRLLNSPD